uniref:Putative capsid protein n=1 Tax=viral metagenome TaxID=1070528 RepID=A0A6M3IFY7_9ZZZZ
MASGMTTTTALADSLPTIIASARIVRENEGVMPNLVEKQTLGKGVGVSWTEVKLDQLTAQSVGETTELENAQQIADSSISITPTMVGIKTRITNRVADRISKNAYAKIGSLAQNAIQRKKNADGLTILDGFSNSYPGSGSSTLTSGHIAAAMAVIQGNATEPGNPPFRCVLHPYQIRDIEDEIVAGVGTYPIAEGLTARVFKEGFRGMIAEAQLYADGNISISSNEAKGGVFAQEAIVLVQGKAPWAYTKLQEHIGGGATDIILYDEYAYGERLDTWGIEIYSDATAPTS